MATLTGAEALATLRASAVLTLAYVTSTNIIDVGKAPEVLLAFNFTVGASTGFTFYVEQSDDATVWYEQSIYVSGTLKAAIYEVTIDGTAIRTYAVPSTMRYLRVRAKALTDAGATLLAIKAKQVRAVGA